MVALEGWAAAGNRMDWPGERHPLSGDGSDRDAQGGKGF